MTTLVAGNRFSNLLAGLLWFIRISGGNKLSFLNRRLTSLKSKTSGKGFRRSYSIRPARSIRTVAIGVEVSAAASSGLATGCRS